VCFKGFCLKLLEKLAGELKFNYTVREVESGYGYMSEDKHEWNGMVRELQDRVSFTKFYFRMVNVTL